MATKLICRQLRPKEFTLHMMCRLTIFGYALCGFLVVLSLLIFRNAQLYNPYSKVSSGQFKVMV